MGNTHNIKLCLHIPPEPQDDDLVFAAQLGVDYVYTWIKEQNSDYRQLLKLKARVESYGLTLYNVGCLGLGKNDKVHLALPGRDEGITRFNRFLQNLGRAGIDTTTFTWEPAGVHSTSRETPARGGALARSVDMEELQKRPPSHSGIYSQQDIWTSFGYFIERVLPVAEEAGVRLALHPNDPPVPEIGGIPCLIHNFDTYKRAFKIADSDFLGMEFCVGCWLEGGEQFGDIFEGIRHFVEQKKVFIVHFRNVSAPLPQFVETFMDDGYMEMANIMQAFADAGYSGSIILDHTPSMSPGLGKYVPYAYAMGYMKALLRGTTPGSEEPRLIK